ncbi:hypothetical protein GCM10010129_69100 [Streptomyces fumigatiscleroticus]|nr:hypothetical protein GCM10010129_69100 [Streptomyces fumigatiscleroticus]
MNLASESDTHPSRLGRRAGPVGAGSPASIHPHVVSEIRQIRAEDFGIPAPVRYRSTAAVYDEGWGGQGHNLGARHTQHAPALEFGRCRSECVHLACGGRRVRRGSRRSPQGLRRGESGIHCDATLLVLRRTIL